VAAERRASSRTGAGRRGRLTHHARRPVLAMPGSRQLRIGSEGGMCIGEGEKGREVRPRGDETGYICAYKRTSHKVPGPPFPLASTLRCSHDTTTPAARCRTVSGHAVLRNGGRTIEGVVRLKGSARPGG
jgi:hypothetical protein